MLKICRFCERFFLFIVQSSIDETEAKSWVTFHTVNTPIISCSQVECNRSSFYFFPEPHQFYKRTNSHVIAIQYPCTEQTTFCARVCVIVISWMSTAYFGVEVYGRVCTAPCYVLIRIRAGGWMSRLATERIRKIRCMRETNKWLVEIHKITVPFALGA